MLPSYLLSPVVGDINCLRFRPSRPYPPLSRCGDLDSFPFFWLPLPRQNQIHAALDDVGGVAIGILPMPASLADKLGLQNPGGPGACSHIAGTLARIDTGKP